MLDDSHECSIGVGGGAAVGGTEAKDGGIITAAETVIGGIPGMDSGVVIVCCCCGIPGISTDPIEDGVEIVIAANVVGTIGVPSAEERGTEGVGFPMFPL